jgi:hypothetical protein
MAGSQQLVSMAPGRDIVEALNEACAGLDGWVQAVGTVDSLELRVAGEGVHPRRAAPGRWSLTSLAGATGGPYVVTVARATKAGIEVLGGELLSGRSEGVTAFVTSTGAAARRDEPAAAAPEPAPTRAPEPKPASSWASAAMQSAAATQQSDEPDDEPEPPGPGDLVQHFAFGLCEVLMGDDERLKIRDLKGPGRIREIRLDMLVVGAPTERDGKRVFRLDRKH